MWLKYPDVDLYFQGSFHIGSLADDVSFCIRNLEENRTSQFWRRTFVRSAFAFIEGMVSDLTALVLLYRKTSSSREGSLLKGILELPEMKVWLLAEQIADVGDDGRLKPRKAKHSATQRLLFFFDTLSEALSSDLTIDQSKNEWRLFKKVALPLRDRLVHPRHDVQVRDSELEEFHQGSAYVMQYLADLLDKLHEGYDVEIELLKTIISATETPE